MPPCTGRSMPRPSAGRLTIRVWRMWSLSPIRLSPRSAVSRAAAHDGPATGRPASRGRAGQVAADLAATEIGHRMDPVLLLGSQPDQPGPVQQHAKLPHLRRRNSSLPEQVHPQPLGQGRGVDLIVPQPRRGDGLAPQRAHQVQSKPCSSSSWTSQPSRTRPRRPGGHIPIGCRSVSVPLTTGITAQ